MPSKPMDEFAVKVQLLYYTFLAEHGRPFASKSDRMNHNRRFYLRMNKSQKKLKEKTSFKNCVHTAWRCLQKDNYPIFIQESEPDVLEMFKKVWQIYHESARAEDSGNNEEVLKRGPNIKKEVREQEEDTVAVEKPPTAPVDCEKVKAAAARQLEKTAAARAQLVTTTTTTAAEPRSILQEYLKMKEDILEKKFRLCDVIEKNVGWMDDYDKMIDKIDEILLA